MEPAAGVGRREVGMTVERSMRPPSMWKAMNKVTNLKIKNKKYIIGPRAEVPALPTRVEADADQRTKGLVSAASPQRPLRMAAKIIIIILSFPQGISFAIIKEN
jgi:hypothetical protein